MPVSPNHVPLRSHFQFVSASQAMEQCFLGVNTLITDSLSDLLFNRSDAAISAVVEHGYVDIEYSSSYYLQTGRSFTPTERYTIRVLFFSCQVTKQDIYNASLEISSNLSSHYLGYSVIKPGNPPTLGRTFIKPPDLIEDYVAFFPTRVTIQANLCGIPLEVEACPYMSQDGNVSACATASLWIATNSLMPKIRGMSEYSSGEITAMALSVNRSFTPMLGSRGLRVDQMERAIIAMGYDPMLWQFPDNYHLTHACHIYAESGIPVIAVAIFPQATVHDAELAAGLHAITIIGYTMASSRHRDTPIELIDGMYSSTAYMPSLIVHDDRMGLYLSAHIRRTTKTEEEDSGGCRSAIEIIHRGETLTGFCQCLIAALPVRVMLTGIDALYQSANVLRYYRESGDLEDKEIILRTFLIRSNTYKHLLIDRDGMSKVLKAIYRSLPMPRYIWVTEYGYAEDLQDNHIDTMLVRGEIIFDSTSANKEKSYLSVHLPGTVAVDKIHSESRISKAYRIEESRYNTIGFDLQKP